jgi:adenylate kinase family enzyme
MDPPDPIAWLASSRRILVLGPCGSGKTTFSIRLGRILNLESLHLDAHFWKPGWIATPQNEWREIVSVLIETDSWIMDGTYESTLDLRIPAADTVILIDSPRRLCLWRVLKRRLTVDDHRRPDAPGGQKLNLAYLRYIWRYPAVTQPLVLEGIRNFGPDTKLIELRSSSDMQNFWGRVQQAVDRERDEC